MPRIIDRFKVTGRGIVVVIDIPSDIRSGRRLSASVAQNDGSIRVFEAWKESLIRGMSGSDQSESFLLVGAEADAAPIGAVITFS